MAQDPVTSSVTFGVCGPVENWPEIQAAGFAFVEPGAATLLQPESPEPPANLATIPTGVCPCANMMLPRDLKIVGEAVDQPRVSTYVKNLCERASLAGIKTIVFGAGASRTVPVGFPRHTAVEQIVWFLKQLAPYAVANKLTIAIEPLNGMECNIITSINEAAEFMRAVDSPAVRLLFDTYHAWMERESLSHLRAVANKVSHVHVADRDGRVAPGVSGLSDYRPVFRILRETNYTGRISVEARDFDVTQHGKAVLTHLQQQWKQAI